MRLSAQRLVVEHARGPEPHAAPRGDERSSSVLSAYADDLSFYALLAGLAWAPFWFGSNRDVAWGVNAVYFGALAILFEASRLVSGRRHAIGIRWIWFPALAFAFVAAWSLVQSSSWVPTSCHHPIWQMAGETLGRTAPGSISVDRDKTVLALTRLTTAGAVFWIALQTCRSSKRARRLVGAIAFIGALYAVYGLVAFFVWPDRLLWFDKVHYKDSLTSTFVNRNSYATYAALGLVNALAIAFSHYLRSAAPRTASFARRLAEFVASTTGRGGGWIACAFIIGIALALTGSRGGAAAAVAGLSTFLFLVGFRGRRNAGPTGSAILLAGMAVAAAFFAYGDFLADRLLQGFASNDRLSVYGLTWLSIADMPLLGFGDGTFEEAFRMYRDGSVGPFGAWDKAHNTYLEMFQGLGAPAAALLLLGLAFLGGRCVYAALTRSRDAVAPLAASAATIVVALHALVDFSVQMQAVALTWAALLGAGVAQSWSATIATEE